MYKVYAVFISYMMGNISVHVAQTSTYSDSVHGRTKNNNSEIESHHKITKCGCRYQLANTAKKLLSNLQHIYNKDTMHVHICLNSFNNNYRKYIYKTLLLKETTDLAGDRTQDLRFAGAVSTNKVL